MLEQPALADPADERDSGAAGQLGMCVAVAQRHHLGKEFDIDQAAAALLDVETAASVRAKLTLDAQAHRRYFADLRAAQSAAEYEFAPPRFDLRSELGLARDDARAYQRLALPHGRGAGAMIVVKAVEGGHQRSGVARGAQ